MQLKQKHNTCSITKHCNKMNIISFIYVRFYLPIKIYYTLMNILNIFYAFLKFYKCGLMTECLGPYMKGRRATCDPQVEYGCSKWYTIKIKEKAKCLEKYNFIPLDVKRINRLKTAIYTWKTKNTKKGERKLICWKINLFLDILYFLLI